MMFLMVLLRHRTHSYNSYVSIVEVFILYKYSFYYYVLLLSFLHTFSLFGGFFWAADWIPQS